MKGLSFMIKVKNLNGTGDKNCSCPKSNSWLDHWKIQKAWKEKEAPKCAAFDCDSPAEYGAHVKKSGPDKTNYIVPLCPSCNKRKEEFHVPERMLASAKCINNEQSESFAEQYDQKRVMRIKLAMNKAAEKRKSF